MEDGLECVPGDSSGAAFPNFHRSGLEHVRNWIRKQRFVPRDLSDGFIRKFLDVKNGDVPKAAAMMMEYFYLRQQPSQIFRDRNPSSADNRKLFDPLYAVPVRSNGEIILLTGLLHRTTKYTLTAHLKLILLTIDCLLWDRQNSFTDLRIVLDGKNFACPTLLDSPRSEWTTFLQDCLSSIPVNLEGFYIVRPPEHAKEILRVHNGIWFTVLQTDEETVEKLPSAILPTEFGGSLGPLDELLETWKTRLEEKSMFFVRFEKMMANDYRRRMRHERELREGGKSFVQQMKLASEVSEYKERYYRRMADLKPSAHPAYGSLRLGMKKRFANVDDTRRKCNLENSPRRKVPGPEDGSKSPSARPEVGDVPNSSRRKQRKPRSVAAVSCHVTFH